MVKRFQPNEDAQKWSNDKNVNVIDARIVVQGIC